MITKEQIIELELAAKDADKKSAEAHKALNDAKDMMAIQLCPHNVGDEIEIGRGKKIKIDNIKRPRWGFGGARWLVEGFVIKKDGSVGLNRSSLESK